MAFFRVDRIKQNPAYTGHEIEPIKGREKLAHSLITVIWQKKTLCPCTFLELTR